MRFILEGSKTEIKLLWISNLICVLYVQVFVISPVTQMLFAVNDVKPEAVCLKVPFITEHKCK